MCGLAGYTNISRTNFLLEQIVLEKMQHVLAHRGPDGYRMWISPNQQLGLIHRRLSIIDLSQAAFQPLFDTEKTVAVCCNGEIYNYKKLRAELESFGYQFSSNSDSEVIVYAYKKWGIACLEKFEGMFAIIIADLQHDQLYLARDRMGIKPLYFSLQGGVLSFASEIKALWQLPWNERKLSSQGLYHYLTYLVTPAPLTLYEGIYKLPPAYYIKLDEQKNVTYHEWYSPLTAVINTSPEEYALLQSEEYCVSQVRQSLIDSVEKHMMSDVPVGVFLSGGVDSSLITALMSQRGGTVKTFNVSFSDGPEFSEVQWARKVARLFNTEHHEITISEKEAFEFFQKMAYHQDEPLADCVCIPLYHVSKLLSDSGVKVVQVGEGSDELVCGYTSYAKYVDVYNKYWHNSQQFIPAFAKQAAYACAKKLFSAKPHRIDTVKSWVENRSLFWSGALAFSEVSKKDILHQLAITKDPVVAQMMPDFDQIADSYTVVDYYLRKLRALMPEADFMTSMIYLDLKHRLAELLLMRVDKMTMATSVESRVPFLDHLFVELALKIPSQFKYKNGITKYVLKKAAEGILPHDVIYRSKVGFAAPTQRWYLQGNYFREYFLDSLHSSGGLWRSHFNVAAIDNLWQKNAEQNGTASVQLWTLHNLMACTT